MNGAAPAAAFSAFGCRTFDLIGGLVPVTGCALHMVPDDRSVPPVLRGVADAVDESYRRRFGTLDPLHPRLFQDTAETIVSLEAVVSPRQLHRSAFYLEFLRPNGYGHVADMFLRREGRIHAVISLLRTDREPAFSASELGTLEHLQGYVEYALATTIDGGHQPLRLRLAHDLPLTPRELDVVELLVRGLSNKAIQRRLGIGLATVKTHLLQVFAKAGVSSRAELISRLLLPDRQTVAPPPSG